MDQNKCEMAGCDKPATHLTSTETKFIEICKDHWHEKYKK